MPTVHSTIFAEIVKKYYEYANSQGAKFRIGLNMSPQDVMTNTDCDYSGSPGCVDATYSLTTDSGSVVATFKASIQPSSSYNLTELSLTVFKPNENWKYQLGVIDLTDFTASILSDSVYDITLENQLTYPTSI